VGLERRITVHMAGILVQAGAAIQNDPASSKMSPGGFCVHSSHSATLGASSFTGVRERFHSCSSFYQICCLVNPDRHVHMDRTM
jgi:hypothetical protein